MGRQDLLDTIRSRRTVRVYEAREIPEEMLLKLVEAARWAPSAVNSQPWSFVLVRNRESIATIGDLADRVLFNTHVRRSAAIVVICADPRGNRYYAMDCAFAAQNMLLEAHALGLGACFVGAFNEAGTKKLLAVPEVLRVVGMVTLGWPAEEPPPPPRLALAEILRLESYTGQRPPSRWRRATNAASFSLAKRFARHRRRRQPSLDSAGPHEGKEPTDNE